MTANLDDPTDLQLIRSLAGEADVVVENFLPGALERRGWGVAPARARHPGLVWCSITGFGPDARRPGYDFVVQAESGWMSITGAPDDEARDRAGRRDRRKGRRPGDSGGARRARTKRRGSSR